MSRRQEIDVTRQLAGEGTPEERRAFAARLAAEPGLAREVERRRRLWDELELPPAAPAPPGFAARIAARARAAAAAGELAPLPVWARAAAAVALVAGALAGVGLGRFATEPAATAAASPAATVWAEDEPIAATYLAATATDETAIVNGEGSAR